MNEQVAISFPEQHLACLLGGGGGGGGRSKETPARAAVVEARLDDL